MLRKNCFAFALVVSCLLAAPAHAALIFITGNVSGDLENVLFNEAGLIGTGLTVTGITNDSNVLVSFTEDSEVVTTPSGGQARVAALDTTGAFNSLLFQPTDPFMTFLLFSANVNVTGGPTLRITATGSETVTYEFAAGNGENRFGIIAENDGDFISRVLIQSLGGDAITDVRQVRVGGVGLADELEPTALVPEPGTLIMLATGLFGLAHHARRRFSR